MKKKIFWLLSLAFALAACDQQEIPNVPVVQETSYQMTIGVNNQVKTRVDDEYPNPDIANEYRPRYIIEIYNNDVLYKRLVQTSSVANFRLVTNQAYDFLVWVDYVKVVNNEIDLQDLHYNTTSLKAISLTGSYYNDDPSRDAFFYGFSKTAEEIGNQANSFNIICKRPFGQLNVIATDWNYSTNASITPETVNISFVVFSEFNVLTGEASNPVATPLTYTVNQNLAVANSDGDGTKKLTCDYIFAPLTGTYVIPYTTITLFNANGDKITDTGSMLFNLPVKRNYKTNVSGMLLSKSGSATVEVDAAWGIPEIDTPIEDPQP